MTQNERDQAGKYPEAALIEAMAKSVWQGNSTSAKIEVAVSEQLKAALLKVTGNDIQSVFITDSDVRHIKKQHGEREALRGQQDVTPDDFALIPLVLNEFDSVEHTDTDKMGNKKLLFKKRIDSLVYLATVERGPRKGEVRTLWKMP